MKNEAGHYNLVLEVFNREPSGSYSEEIRQAYAKVQAYGPRCVVELHFNSASDPSATGTEVLYRAGDSRGRGLAEAMVASMSSLLQLPLRGDNGVKALVSGDRGAGSVYAIPGLPSVLLEPFFGSNPNDCVRMASLGEQALALSYLRGLRDWVVGAQQPVTAGGPALDI
jgi:N-acetylmuramoyl-L-alanine amidase